MIYVCNIAEMSQHVAALTPSHLVSLVEPTLQPPTPVGFDAARHLRVAVHDIVEAEDGHILPDVAHVEELIRFVRGWRGEQALLVHWCCRHQSIDRSSADRPRRQPARRRAPGGGQVAPGCAACAPQPTADRPRRQAVERGRAAERGARRDGSGGDALLPGPAGRPAAQRQG